MPPKRTANDTDHYCLARIDVPQENAEAFNEALVKVKPLFREHDWNLRLNLRPDPVMSSSGGSSLPIQFLHLWTIPNFDSLVSVMYAAADSEDYVDLLKLVVAERQDLTLGLPYDPGWMDETPNKSPCYLLEEVELARAPSLRLSFDIAMNYAKAGMAKSDWQLCYGMNYSTGTINRYVHVWGMPRGKREEGLKDYLDPDSSWAKDYAAAVQYSERSWWIPVRK
ncbi:MAG: hypothetical protein QM784_21365 [Polyangiaceae bacterium]